MNKLLQRVLTALVLIAVLLVVFFTLPQDAAVGALGAFVLASGWEWAGFLGPVTRIGRTAYAVGTAVLMAAVLFLTPRMLSSVLVLGLAWWVVALVLVLSYPIRVGPLPAALCGWLVLIPAWAGVLVLLRASGAAMVLYVLAMIWAADIGAYFTGRRIGRVKLAPRVSPGKTWEGVAGGLVAAAAVALVGAEVLGLPAGIMLPVGLSLACISVLGDLTVSLFKRNAGLKDSGHLFPGHGGVLDRVDGLTSAVPLFAVVATQLGLIAQ